MGLGFESLRVYKKVLSKSGNTFFVIVWAYIILLWFNNGSVEKNFLSATPLRFALNNLIFALKDSAIALDGVSRKFRFIRHFE